MKKILLLFSLFASLFSQTNNDWETVSSMNDINDIVYTDNLIFYATNGGIFNTDITGANINRITNLDGLSSLSVNKLVIDDNGNIILGNNDGIIDLYNISSSAFTHLYELQSKQINGMFFQNDTLWIAAEKGVGLFVYLDEHYRFIDYYVNFPIMPGRISAVQLYQNRIWAATDKGLLSAPSDVSRYTLNDPANWTLFTTTSGLSDKNILDLAVIDNELWVGTAAGLSVINESLNIRIETNWGNLQSGHITYSSAGEIYIGSKQVLYKYDPDYGKTLIKQFSSDINALAPDKKGEIWVGLHKNGYYYTTWDTPRRTDGLNSNISRFIIKDSKGRIWSSTGKYKSTPNEGFSIRENALWKSINYSGARWHALGNSDVFYEDNFGNIFIGTWGGGLIILPNNQSDFVYLHSYTNSGYMYLTKADSIAVLPVGPNDDSQRGFFDEADGVPQYEVIGAINGDNKNYIWFANFNAANKKFIAAAPHDENGMLSLDKEKWQYFGNNDVLSELKYGAVNSIEFDDLNRVWLGTQSDGVYVLDYNNTLYDKSDDIIYHLGINENLFSADILSLAYDQNGIMWIGTQGGLNSIDIYSVSHQYQFIAYKHIGDETGKNGPLGNWINQVCVDKYNNKWVATSKGLSILPDNKSPWEENAWISYTVRNSGLVNNNVHSIFTDQITGETVIGTENGICVYHGAFSELKSDYSLTACGPNPFHLNRGNDFIIKNLMMNSIVKIYTLNGRLIRTLTVENNDIEGGRASWNGYDESGHPVSSGIYYYLAYTNESDYVTGKIAVIRD
jgi:ligand-binding sensor domain-containing protein